jgi:L-asparaginase
LKNPIHIITTGGTIDKVYFDDKGAYEVGGPQVRALLRDANITLPISFTALMRKDSLDLTDKDRTLIQDAVSSLPGTQVVVTHGTDTMVQTAKVLKEIRGKVIVFTGSMQPALFKGTDALFNIGAAITAVQILPFGVYIVMNGRIFDPYKVMKNRVSNCFEEI